MKTLHLWALCYECHSLRKHFKLGVFHSLVQKLLPAVFAGFLFQNFFFLFLPQGKNRKEMCVKECSLFSFCGDCVSYEKASKVPGAVCLFM